MPKGARGNRHGRKNRGGGRKMGSYQDRAPSWNTIPRENALFKETYRGLDILDDDEFEELFMSMQKDLPNSFRFTASKPAALEARKVLKERYIPKITAEKYKDEFVPAPMPVPWYPDDLAWDIKVPKGIIRKHPPFAAFQKYLVQEADVGNISRQELVSMIPPLMLDVQPGMVVLDMCAAPGSKSAQLAEMIHGDEEDRVWRTRNNMVDIQAAFTEDYGDDGRSTGLLISNDSDYKRSYMLTHQLKRLNLAGIIITNNDASIFPSIDLPPTATGTKGQLKYDRILADVPCSGDGTVRKNISIWQKWTPKDGIGLHGLQRRILIRGLELLKVDGLMVYSTCSLNPIENEAVVASAIKDCGGPANIEIVDCSEKFSNLKRKPGLTTWKVFENKQINWDDPPTPEFFDTYEDWQEYAKMQRLRTPPPYVKPANVDAGMFPPDPTLDIPLHRCIRIYPHLQDTGGFFVTVLRKKAPFKKASTQYTARNTEKSEQKVSQPKKRGAEDEPVSNKKVKVADDGANNALEETDKAEAIVAPATTDGDDSAPSREVVTTDQEVVENKVPAPTPANDYKKKKAEPKGEVFKFLSADDPTLQGIFEFYGLSERFPRDRFLVRNEDGKAAKAIYYASDLAKHILTSMEGTSMKFIHGGIKMFVKHEAKNSWDCNWRIQTEGVNIIAPWCNKRRLVCNDPEVFKLLVKEMFPKFNKDSKAYLGDLYDQIEPLSVGCCLLELVPDETKKTPFAYRQFVPLWRNPGSLNLMCAKEDRTEILLRMYGEEKPVIKDHTKDPGYKRDERAPGATAPTGAGDEKMEEATAFRAGMSEPEDEDEDFIL